MDDRELMELSKTLCEGYADGIYSYEEYFRYRFELFRRGAFNGALREVRTVFEEYENGWKENRKELTVPGNVTYDNDVFSVMSAHKDGIPPYIRVMKNGKRVIVPHLLKNEVSGRERIVTVVSPGQGICDYLIYTHGVYKRIIEEELMWLIKDVIIEYDPALVTMPLVRQVTQDMLTDKRHVQIEDLNRNEYGVNFINGTLDLRTMELMPHDAEDLSTVQLNALWQDTAEACPVFERFLEDLSGNDRQKILLIKEMMGLIFSNVSGYRFKKAMFMVGEGNTGKSVLRELINRLIGTENTTSVDLQSLENDRFATAMLFNKRVAGCSDLSYSTLREMAAFKSLTGGDRMYAQFKSKPQFEFVYKGVLWFSMNALPKFGGDKGNWVYERMAIVNCGNPLPEEKRDVNLLDKLLEEKNGIIRTCLEALKGAINRGFRLTEPLDERKAVNSYRIENSPELKFLYHSCVLRNSPPQPNDEINTTVMFEVFRAWCHDNTPCYKPKKCELKKYAMELFGCQNEEDLVIRKAGRYYYIFTLNEETKKEYEGKYFSKIMYRQVI